jgi:hypothetical protein
MSHPQESTTTAGAGFRALLTTAELLRIPLPRTWVNKGPVPTLVPSLAEG